MKEQLVTFETAKLAKEKGFDWVVFRTYHEDFPKEKAELQYDGDYDDAWIDEQNWNNWYEGHISAPTQTLLQKWLREEFGLIMWVQPCWEDDRSIEGYTFELVRDDKQGSLLGEDHDEFWDKFEDAFEAGLQKTLTFI